MPESTHGRCVRAVHERILSLDFEDLPVSQVYLRKIIVDRNLTLPCIMVSHQGTETEQGGTNARDEWGYPVMVAIVLAENQDLAFEDFPLQWRRRIRNAFHHKRLAGVTENMECRWEPGAIIDENAFAQHNLLISAMTIRCICRESRS